LIKNCNLLIPPTKDAQTTGEASALKKEHPALQNMKILYFFLYFWVIFALLDPDPATQINADPCGSTTLQITEVDIIRPPWVLDPDSDMLTHEDGQSPELEEESYPCTE